MSIAGKIINLRAIERNDLPHLHTWANDEEIQYLLGAWHFPLNRENHSKWFNDLKCDDIHQRFIVETKNGEVIGMANLLNINWKDRNAFHGMVLGENSRGKGYGTDTVLTIMKYAFYELGLNRLDGSIIEYNEPSKKLYIGKCFWKIEGVQKKWYFRKGKFWDKIIVGIIKEDCDSLWS
jgi:RimJ/RimL family protein N-acetyltransferase